MKRLFLLIAVCMIGMVLPQGMWAGDVTIDTSTPGKVIVTSDNAGDFATYLSNASSDELTSLKVDEIVLVGKFNASDLSTLQSKGCATQKKVDMSATYFIKSASSANGYILYHSTPSNPQDGKYYVIGAKMYIGQPGGFSLQETEQSSNPNQNNWITCNILPEERSSVTIYSADQYYRLPTTLNYYQKKNNQWVLIPSPDEGQISAAIAAQDHNTTSNMPDTGGYGDNSIIKVRSDDCSYKYYKSIASFEWKDAASLNQDYTDGTETSLWYPDGISSAPSPTDYNSKAYAEGILKVGSQLDDPSQTGGDEEYDYTQMSFSYWGTNVKTAITSNNVLSENDHLSSGIFSGCTSLENITLGSGAFDFKIGNASDFTKIKSIEVKKDVRQLGSLAQDGDGFFPSSSSLSTVTFEMGGTTPLKLGKSCFNGCTKIENVIIPARTQLIEQYAFGGTNESKLAVVKFNNDANVTYPMVIKHEAFNNQKHITDVWVDINPDVRPLVCEYEAFDFDTMDGQTTPTKPMAILHFNKEYYDYYAGNWKKGMSLGHLDLGVIRDGAGFVSGGATITKGTNSQLVNQTTSEAILGSQSSDLLKTGQIKDKRPANGWQQFARTDTGIDIIIEKGMDFRTYSTEVALVKPDWMHIYRVTNFDDGFNENSDASSREEADAAHKVATTQEIVVGVEGVANCIPMNTGVIRVDNVTNDAIYYIMEWSDLTGAGVEYDETWEYPYQDNLTKDKVNFMKPTSTPKSNPEFTIIGPVERDASGSITHRVFGLKKVQKDNGITGEFLRAKVNTKMARNRAYLSLPADLFHWIDESTSSTQPATGTIPNNNTNNSKISLIIDTDFDLGLNNGIATAIQQVIEKDMYKNDTFYTLQGVKVSKPTTKGVYIHNGKKVLIK